MNIFKFITGKIVRCVTDKKCRKHGHYYVKTGKTKASDNMAATEYQEKCLYFLHHVGMHKSQAMQVVVGMKNNKIKYKYITRKVWDRIDPKEENVLILDCFDNSESRKLLEGINNCLHIGFSPEYAAEIIWGENYTTPNNISKEQNDICNMEYAVPFINFVVGLTGMVIKKYLDIGIRDNLIITDKYRIRKL